MNAPNYPLIAFGSVGGAALGLATLWLRAAARRATPLTLRATVTVLALGLGGASLLAFARVFPVMGAPFATVATFLLTSLVAVAHAGFSLQPPRHRRLVSDAEFRFLRHPGLGVTRFGRALNASPLRALGGAVYLRDARSPAALLPGLAHAASVHFWAGLLCLAHAATLAAAAARTAAAASLALNLALNLYPLLHLRLTCARLQRARTGRAAT